MTAPPWGRAVRAVYLHEVRRLFLTPVASVAAVGFLLVGGLLFVVALSTTGEATLRPVVPNLALTLALWVPLLTMRSFAEEARTGTSAWWASAPVSPAAVVLGKWLAVVTWCGAAIGMTLPYAGVLAWYGDPDPGVLVGGYLGLLACAVCVAAAGVFLSSLVREESLAAVLGVLVGVGSWLAGLAHEAGVGDGFARVAFPSHLASFARGVLDAGDLAWFAGVTGWWLVLTVVQVGSWRWR